MTNEDVDPAEFARRRVPSKILIDHMFCRRRSGRAGNFSPAGNLPPASAQKFRLFAEQPPQTDASQCSLPCKGTTLALCCRAVAGVHRLRYVGQDWFRNESRANSLTHSKSCRTRANAARNRPTGPNSVEISPGLDQSWHLARMWPTSAKLGLEPATSGPEVDRIGPDFGHIGGTRGGGAIIILERGLSTVV